MPQPGNPQSLNRYTYSRNSPVTYSDPTGHAADQDTGYFPPLDIKKQTPAEARMAGDYCVVRMLLNRMQNPTYLEWAERQAQITPREDQERWEPIYHALATADTSLINVGAGMPSLLLMGSASAGGGTKIHHIATNKNEVRGGQWTLRFEKIFKKAGLSLDSGFNKVELPDHYGPHTDEYHEWVYTRLTSATEGLEGDPYSAALKHELASIAEDLKANPGLTQMGR